jgi:hypothetical protein
MMMMMMMTMVMMMMLCPSLNLSHCMAVTDPALKALVPLTSLSHLRLAAGCV